jgi:hypothetical protein
MYGGREGQIIGMKSRERQAAENAQNLRRRIDEIAETLRQSLNSERHGADQRLIEWAVDELDAALRGGPFKPFDPPS